MIEKKTRVPNFSTLRSRLGAESDRGRLLSNLDQQSPWRSDPDPRPWATHPMQSVQGMMKWQVELLAGGK